MVCAEEDTGSSSVGPSSRPSTIAWRTARVCLCGGIGRGIARVGASAAAADDQVDEREDDERDHRVVDVVKAFAHALPFGAHGFAREAEAQHPGHAPRECE